MTVWKIDVFDRLVLTWRGIERQHLFMNPDTGKLTWVRVWPKKLKKENGDGTQAHKTIE